MHWIYDIYMIEITKVKRRLKNLIRSSGTLMLQYLSYRIEEGGDDGWASHGNR